MANHVLPVLCILLAVGHLSAGSLDLNVKPDTISPGLTSDLTVNCSFTYNNQQNISTIISLVISKAESQNGQPGSFSKVLSINSYTNQVNNEGNTNANTSGNIDSNTLDAFLSLSWSSPSQAESGFYRCDANVMDEFGQPFDISRLAEVTYSGPDLNDLIEIVGTLQADLAQMNKELDIQVQTIKAQNATIAAQNSKLSDLNSTVTVQNSTYFTIQEGFKDQIMNKTNQITDLQAKMNQQISDLQGGFIKSDTYNGHFYLIAGILVTHTHMSEYLCNISQGYLAEIEDESEHKFVVNFLNNQSSHLSFTLGATLDDQSGQWVFRHSGRPVTYFKWSHGEPDSKTNCMFMSGPQGEMSDMMCGLTGTYSFLCEVPES